MKYSVSMIINRFDKKENLKYVFFYRNTPSSDGSINVGDVVSIKKTINSVIIFEYNIIDDNTIHDPFA